MPHPFARSLGERVGNHHIQTIEIHAVTDLTIREAVYVPVPATTTPIVRMMILKSSQMLQLSI